MMKNLEKFVYLLEQSMNSFFRFIFLFNNKIYNKLNIYYIHKNTKNK